MAEFSSKDESALTFKKGEIIAVVPKHDAYTEKVIINCIEYEMYSGLSIKQTVWHNHTGQKILKKFNKRTGWKLATLHCTGW